jgi:hypothetical protein
MDYIVRGNLLESFDGGVPIPNVNSEVVNHVGGDIRPTKEAFRRRLKGKP